jgi:hypothetical protein
VVGESLTAAADAAGDEDSTRALPMNELEVRRDGAYVVRGDAVGDEATVAVMPGLNQASPKNMAAFAATMMADDAAINPNRPPVGRPPDFAAPAPPPGPSWNDYPMGPNGGFPQSSPQMPTARGGPSPTGPQPYMPSHPSSPHAPLAGPGMGSMGPMGPMGPGQMSVGPTMGSVHGHPYAAGPMSVHQQPPWASQAPSPKLSKQIIFLVVIGIVCLAIFITGIVLFATTKF